MLDGLPACGGRNVSSTTDVKRRRWTSVATSIRRYGDMVTSAMRSFTLPVVLAGLVLALVAPACSDDGELAATTPDAGPATTPEAGSTVGRDGGGSPSGNMDGGATDAEAPLPSATESEPNDGRTETETNTMTVPGEMKGAIDPADDRDIFTVDVAPGELWQWTITPAATLAPHLAVFDLAPDNLNPSRVVFAEASETAVLDHFVLRAGKFVAGVRDARNVPTPSGRGGPSFGYALRAVKRALTPVAATFPTTKTGKLAGPGALDFYAFSATKGTTFGIVINAKRKATPSTLDSRLSLFDLGRKKAIITNDNAGASSDSQIGGEIPDSGDYLVVVENEGADASDLSYEIVFQTTEP